MPFAILWLLLDLKFMKFMRIMFRASAFMLLFMLLHLTPVWICAAGVSFSVLRYKNACYIVTDRAVYVSGGMLVKHFEAKPFAELSHVNLHRSIFDQHFGVGDVIMTTDQYNRNGSPATMKIEDCHDYQAVFKLVKKLQTDIYSDTMYPNDRRPPENHGYHTKYRG